MARKMSFFKPPYFGVPLQWPLLTHKGVKFPTFKGILRGGAVKTGKLVIFLAFLTYYLSKEKKETIFNPTRKRLVRKINFIVQTEFLKFFCKANLKTRGKLLFNCEYRRQNRMTVE